MLLKVKIQHHGHGSYRLKEAIPESIGMTLISDRDKGLESAEERVYGNTIQRLICCFH